MTQRAEEWNAKVDAGTATIEGWDQMQVELEKLQSLQQRYCFTTRTP
jgi:hypothetical protein